MEMQFSTQVGQISTVDVGQFITVGNTKTPEGKERQRKSVWKHGYWTKEAVAERKFIRDMIKKTKEML
jgi:hypothetical protein